MAIRNLKATSLAGLALAGLTLTACGSTADRDACERYAEAWHAFDDAIGADDPDMTVALGEDMHTSIRIAAREADDAELVDWLERLYLSGPPSNLPNLSDDEGAAYFLALDSAAGYCEDNHL